MKIRMKFKKQGALKFVGHLDILRYFQKVMRRADVDICYSEGFSPHQIMSFAAPLGVGLISNGEYVDIEVNSTKDSKTMIQQINLANAGDFEVVSYRKLEDSAKNAMSMVAAADYKVWFKEGYIPADTDAFFKSFEKFSARDKIEIIKKTKKGEKAMDLKSYLYEISVEDGVIFMKLASGSTANIKPELVLGTFYESIGEAYPLFAFQVEREDVYADEGDETGATGHKFISLEEYGVDIE